MNEFFCVDMNLTHGRFFVIFEQAHGVADIVVVKVQGSQFFKTGIGVIERTHGGDIHMSLENSPAQPLLHGFGLFFRFGGLPFLGNGGEQVFEGWELAVVLGDIADDVR